MKYKRILESSKFVKSKDLNHHKTLFAGTMASWIVENTFIHASTIINEVHSIVCLKIHGLVFKTPVFLGDIITFRTIIAHIGSSSITVYCEVFDTNNPKKKIVDSFVTFVHIDSNGNAKKHNIKYEPKTKEEKNVYKRYRRLLNSE